jgi:N6-L-threonylcarbamoyladenine synthase/protein kinase Bud32
MRVLGIESTAHTFGVGIVEGDPSAEEPHPQVLANERELYTPAPEDEPGGTTGGIHPREAANHHARLASDVLARALGQADTGLDEVDAIAFSQSPGLGPCLRTGATVARALALREELALVGVNHCVAHLEIGRAVCNVDDPLLLYASGANTQVVAHARGRYRVFGETLDIGVGNFLDKLARRMGQPFPGGPEIERLAARGDELLELPYTIKGMDVAFSGILTAAQALLDDHREEDVAYSVQETVFAMLTEVTERALAHVGKEDVVLGGGVACNERLTGMVNRMGAERGATSHRPPKPLLVDNGAMIAWAGAVAHEAGRVTPVADSRIDQKLRTDQVEVPWRSEPKLRPDARRGGEAIVDIEGELVTKARPVKDYRHPALDERLRRRRTSREARLLARAREAGVPTPIVHDVDPPPARLRMRRARGVRLRDALEGLSPEDQRSTLEAFGHALASLHQADIAHGDPTTSNAFVREDGRVELIDFGLASLEDEPEPKATDLHVLDEALDATHDDPAGGFDAVLAGYRAAGDEAVLGQLEEVRARGRYRGSEDAA